MKGQEILIPLDIREYYAISPENLKSLTIIETINAAGEYPPPTHDHHSGARFNDHLVFQ
jgi:hypothetical protein